MQTELDELLDLVLYCNTIYKGKYYKIKILYFAFHIIICAMGK